MLALHPDGFVEHFISRGDDFGRGGVGPLRRDQAGELGRQVDIGAFQRRSGELPAVPRPGGESV